MALRLGPMPQACWKRRPMFPPARISPAKAGLITRYGSLRSSRTRFLYSPMTSSRARIYIRITTDGGGRRLSARQLLLRISKSDDPQYFAIGHALHVLVGQGMRLCYTSQTLGEFWNAATRPLDKNGFGLSVAETDRLARVIEGDFEFLPPKGGRFRLARWCEPSRSYL